MPSGQPNQVKLWRQNQVDNNNPSANTNPVPPNPAPAPQVPPQPAPPPPAANGGKKMMFMIVGGLAIIILLALGVFWYISRQQEAKKADAQNEQQNKQPAPAETISTLEQDLNSINVGSDEADFTSVDADLDNL